MFSSLLWLTRKEMRLSSLAHSLVENSKTSSVVSRTLFVYLSHLNRNFHNNGNLHNLNALFFIGNVTSIVQLFQLLFCIFSNATHHAFKQTMDLLYLHLWYFYFSARHGVRWPIVSVYKKNTMLPSNILSEPYK